MANSQSRTLLQLITTFFVVTVLAFVAAPTQAQVTLVEDINPGSDGMGANEFWELEGTAYGSALYFAATTATAGTEPWVSDGTESGTSLIVDIWSGTESSNPQDFVSVGDGVYFTVATGSDPTDRTLWRSNGTGGGTSSLGTPAFSVVGMGGSAYFVGWDATHGWELWKASSGTAALVSDINPGDADSTPDAMAVVDIDGIGERLFFFATVNPDEFTSVYALWISDGIEAGTVQVKDILDGATGTITSEIVAFDGRAFFPASDATGHELWASDGTEAGTVQIKDIRTSGSSNPHQLTVVGDLLFFVATGDSYGRELWVSDGTSDGTHIVLDLAFGSESSDVNNLIPYNGKLYFTVTMTESGNELWSSDGTAGGTSLFADLHTGVDGYGDPESSSPDDLTVGGGLLFFEAGNQDYGPELWVSDGTTPRTLLVHDLLPGPGPYGTFGPRGPIEVGDSLFFFADDGSIGHELYALPTADVISFPEVSDGPTTGRTEEAYTYAAAGGISVRGNSTQFMFHWGDGTNSGWLGVGVSEADKTWNEENDFDVWVEAKSATGTSIASAALTVDIDFTESIGTQLSGPENGYLGNEYTFTVTGDSTYGHDMEVMVDWGDEDTTSWTALDTETDAADLSHTWATVDEYEFFVTVRCIEHQDRWHTLNQWMSIGHEDIAEPVIDGPTGGDAGVSLGFTVSGESNAGHDLEYSIDWGDGSPIVGWTPFGAGETAAQVSHTYEIEATHTMQLGVRCATHNGYENWTTKDVTIAAEEVSVVSVDGPSEGDLEQTYQFTLSGSSSHGHDLQYKVEWGDGNVIDWTDFGSGVTSVQVSHSWDYADTIALQFGVRCQAHPEIGEAWHEHFITIAAEYISELSIDGPSTGIVGDSQEFTVTARSSAGHDVEYQVDWGDGITSDWQTIDNLSDTAAISHAWGSSGEKILTLNVRCYEHPDASDFTQTAITINNPPPEGYIFSDGFESGDTSRW
jgi:ELWxxDGT repeat protein